MSSPPVAFGDRFDTSTPAVVLKFDPNPMHHGGLGAIRSLGRAGVEVYGVHEWPLAPAAQSRYLAGRWFWRPDPEHADALLRGMHTLAERIGRRAVLLPTDDAGAIFLAEHANTLRACFRFPRPPRELPRSLADKAALHRLCTQFGMPTPRSEVPDSFEQATAFAAEVGFPLITKVITPWSGPKEARSTVAVTDPGQLGARWDAVPGGLLLQELVPNTVAGAAPAQDWFFHGYCDGEAQCRPAYTGVKERSYPARAGLTSCGRAVDNQELRARVAAFLEDIGYRGVLDLDLRHDPRDGEYKLLDFNPRLGAQFRLFDEPGGLDLVRAAYLHLTGQPIPSSTLPGQRRFIVENYDPLAASRYWRDGELTARGWIRSLHAQELAWFAPDDLRPFGLMCLRMGLRAAAGRPAAKPRHLTAAAPRYRPGRAAPHEPSDQARAGEPILGDTKESEMNGTVDVAIIGAGPYGLSLAAHLRAAGIEHRVFGTPMRLWRSSMPRGMLLKSQGYASNLSAPNGADSLAEFCRERGRPYADYGLPVGIADFLEYADWFRAHHVPELEEVLVDEVAAYGDVYRLLLADGTGLTARNVIVATGVEHFTRMPSELAALPPARCTHSSEHTDLRVFADREVLVLGAGQAALETAALLHEGGADVRMIARAARLRWNGQPLAPNRSPVEWLREPEAGLGSGWGPWFYSNHPALYRRLPSSVRTHRARRAMGPAGAYWLRRRVEGVFPVRTGHAIRSAQSEGDGIRVGLRVAGAGDCELTADHIIAATGYRPELARLTFLDPELRARVTTLDASPAVDAGYQSSVSGLYFMGPAVAASFGPVMRFVYGADHAATTVSARLAAGRSPRRVLAGATR